MKLNIFIPDLLTETKLEKKILGKKYNIILSSKDKFENLSDNFFSKIHGIMTGHHVKFDKKKIKKLKKCKIIVRYGVGFDNVDIKQCGLQNIKVFNVPDYGVDEVADHTLGLILDLSRYLTGNDLNLREQLKTNKIHWKYDLNKNQIRLKKLNLGIIGLGRIGTALSLRSKNIFNKVLFYDPNLPDGIEKSLSLIRMESISNLFKNSDIISVHVPSSSENKFFLKDALFKNIKKKIIFINTSRGDLVKNSTLSKYFERSKISALGLDVFEKEPIKIDDPLIKIWLNPKNIGKIIFSPHNAFYSKQALFEIRFKALKTLKKYFETGNVKNCINKSYLKLK